MLHKPSLQACSSASLGYASAAVSTSIAWVDRNGRLQVPALEHEELTLASALVFFV